MKISPSWLREFVDLPVDDRQLAEDLTLAGIAVESVSGEGSKTIFEMEITTNRPDAMNHYGVAREASAVYDRPLKWINPALPPRIKPAPGILFPIEIGSKEDCARYTARIIRGVTVKDSPDSISRRLLSVDQRPINNVADASNYTLWEMGHPTHAFDLDLIEGGKILVRRAFTGETLKTLDGVERKLSPEDLVIADAHKPIGLAGVMGGFDTMITAKTKNILIESAWFDPAAIRKSSRRHGLHTDASHRFERGADFGATALACARVAQRILESAGGQVLAEIDVTARELDQAPVELRPSEVHRILGKPLGVDEIVRVLRRLGFELMPEPGDDLAFTVHLPSWRLDIEREIDVIEEIARLHGYDKFADTLPAFSGSVVELPDEKKDQKLRSSLLALGYNEAISLTFISHEEAEQFARAPVLELENPLSEEASVMRTSLVPGILNMLAYNLNRGNSNVRLFEHGNVFERAGAKADQRKRVSFGATGNAVLPGINQAGRPLSFFDIKGDVETLLMPFGYRTLTFDAKAADYYHPERSARALMDGSFVAQFGQLHPEIAASRKLRQDVFFAQIYVDQLYKHDLRAVRYQALPRYPSVERDFSFVLDDSVIFEKVQRAVQALHLSELRGFAPVEIFRGGAMPAGKYALLLRATFQSNDRTLREEEVAQWSAGLIQAMEELGGKLRG